MSGQRFQPAARIPPPEPWVKAVVTVNRPPAAALDHYSRVKKLQVLEENARQQRAELIRWIKEHDLACEVEAVGKPTPFNLFFVKCTAQAAKALREAPGVVAVTTTEEWPTQATGPLVQDEISDSGKREN